MSKIFALIIVFLTMMAFDLTAQNQIPAFPGAEGGGMYTTGGRGGKILYVTSLEDNNNEGTLRWAISQSGSRIIMFNVSGTIRLKSALRISNGNVTIAGQTAPGDGICLRDYELFIGADNVIIRYIRFRLGNAIPTVESDAIWSRYRKNIIIDHCSMSWSIDECASFYSNENFTLQWCILAESLNNAGHAKGAHGYGGIWGGKNASFHHNLLAHHNSRNPRFNGWKRSGLSYNNPLNEERVDFRNNVIYNFGDNSSYGGEAAGKYNIVGNYIKYGPATKSSIRYKITQIDIDKGTSITPRWGNYYIKDNYVYGSAANTQNNWNGVTYASGVNQTAARVDVPFDCTPTPTHPAEVAFEKVLSFSGASLKRDTVDARIVHETRTGTATYLGSVTKRPGIIDTPEDVGGYPTYNTAIAPIDSDKDGIPDGWLDQNYPGKKANETHESGYTFVEIYINSLVQHISSELYSGIISSARYSKVSIDSEIRYELDNKNRKLNINANSPISSITITDIAGRTISSQKNKGISTSVDLINLPPSIYIITVRQNNGKPSSFKIVMQ